MVAVNPKMDDYEAGYFEGAEEEREKRPYDPAQGRAKHALEELFEIFLAVSTTPASTALIPTVTRFTCWILFS